MNCWRYVYASVVGSSHSRLGAACQDCSECREVHQQDGSSVLLAAVSDGAGSAPCAQAGAFVATALFLDEMEKFLKTGSVEGVTPELIEGWFKDLQQFILKVAEVGQSLQDYACTFLGAVVGAELAVFVQVGDGAICTTSAKEPEVYRCVFWPQRGEYANTTNFATELSVEFAYLRVDRCVEEVALFTDGIQHLALHYATSTAFQPFFQAMFRPLRQPKSGYLKELSQSLALFLGSARVRSRTDDDVTLLLASRRSGAGYGTDTI